MERIKNLFNLDGKVAIVTGASKGIGESIARGLAEFGAKVVISSRKQPAVDAVAEEFQADGLEAIGIACHVGEEVQLQDLVDKTVAHYGGIDILINNAGTNPFYGSLLDIDNSSFDKILNVNLKACHLLAKLCHPIMKSRGGGSIVNISSVGGERPGEGLGVYSVSKAALIMLTKVQAREWGGAGIRVNAILPGLIKTKFSAALWQNEKLLAAVEKSYPISRIAEPDEMAGLGVFLASDAASYCTGGVHTADGGYLVTG